LVWIVVLFIIALVVGAVCAVFLMREEVGKKAPLLGLVFSILCLLISVVGIAVTRGQEASTVTTMAFGTPTTEAPVVETDGRSTTSTTQEPSEPLGTLDTPSTDVSPETISGNHEATTTTIQVVAEDPAELFLTDAELVSRGSDVDVDGEFSLSGVLFSHSIRYNYDFLASGDGSAEYNLGRKYKVMRATIGVNDSAQEEQQVGIFMVYVDDKLVLQEQVRFGEPKAIEVDVSNCLRLRLVCARPDSVQDAILAGVNDATGVSNGYPDLVWGSPKIYR
jgi:hypothetical protein